MVDFMRNKMTSLVWHTVSYQKLIYKNNFSVISEIGTSIKSRLQASWASEVWGQQGLLFYLHVMNSWSVEMVTWGHVLIQKPPASAPALALLPHTCIMVRTDSRSAFVHWRSKQRRNFLCITFGVYRTKCSSV